MTGRNGCFVSSSPGHANRGPDDRPPANPSPDESDTGTAGSFGRRLGTVVQRRGRLCVGIDPHAHLLARWGLPDSAAGAREFGLRVVDAVAGRAGIVKPQIAFFERHGSAGYAALEEVLAAARAAGLLIIADVKRGDIGSSLDAYAEAWLSPGHPLESDAITINPYLGFGAVEDTLRRAERSGKGAFLLAVTSNPHALALQGAVIASGVRRGLTVAAGILADVDEWNARAGSGPGSIGVVLGATMELSRFGIGPGVAGSAATPVLAPGFGAQGAKIGQLKTIFGERSSAVLVSESRSILSAGPGGIAAAIAARTAELTGVPDHG